MKIELLEVEWEENRKNYMKSISDLRDDNTSLRGQLSNKDKEKETELNLQKKKIGDLQHGIEVRKGNFNSLMTDLKNKSKEVEEMKKYVDEMRDNAEKAEKLVAELRKEKPKTLLAEHEKPTQESMIEEGESDFQETSFLSAEEGACADLDSTSCRFK